MPLIKLEGHVDNNSSNELTISTDTYTSLKIISTLKEYLVCHI